MLVHGWDSARDRMLANVQFLHAAGFHCLTFDVRGNGANPAETLPVSAGEFGADALAGFATLVARPEVTIGAVLGHSMGAIGAILAAAADPRVAAVVSSSTPSDPRRLVSETFRLAGLPFPAPIAGPAQLADDARVPAAARPPSARHQRPRGDRPVSRTDPPGPRRARPGDPAPPCRASAGRRRRRRAGDDANVELFLVPDGGHTWLYENEAYRRQIAAFLARSLGGPLSPEAAADAAGAVVVSRLPEPEGPLVGSRTDGVAAAFLVGASSVSGPGDQ